MAPTSAPTPTPVITSTPVPDEEDDLGNIIEYNSAYYELTEGSTPTAEFLWIAGNATSVNIGGTVNAHGKKYKVTKIADFAFEGNKNIKEITIGSGVKTIGKEAFSKCSSLERVVIGKDVTTIGASAFYKCKSLRSVTLPSKLKKISSKAFYYCTDLEDVIVTGTKLKKVGSKAFKGTGNKLVITVPGSKLAAYKKLFQKSGISKKAVIK